MTREITADYNKLECFIKKFKLKIVLKEKQFAKGLKPMHKNLFSLMTFYVELEHNNQSLAIIDKKCLSYLQEAVSDLGQSLFCWIQGAYKPSCFMLRSSIETF